MSLASAVETGMAIVSGAEGATEIGVARCAVRKRLHHDPVHLYVRNVQSIRKIFARNADGIGARLDTAALATCAF